VGHLQPATPVDLLSHWRSPELLLSQSCGFPLMTQLPDVQVVGAFHYAAPGCEGVNYRSWLVGREEDSGKTLADFRGRRVACNSPDSWSGYNVLLSMVAGLGVKHFFFARTLFSGSHRRSLAALREGMADLAAIDCVTWALLQCHEPWLINGLTIIGGSPQAPGLPLIAGPGTSPATLAKLRAALHQVAGSEQAEKVLINGFSALSREDWQPLLARRNAAAGLGVMRLSEEEVECGEGHHPDDHRGKQAAGHHAGHGGDNGRR
jgi:ABC-type phosphate/phosphonate transport system substrate-binding protein